MKERAINMINVDYKSSIVTSIQINNYVCLVIQRASDGKVIDIVEQN